MIDLSADFRIRDISTWEQWYKMTHAAPQLVSQAVYGLCELHKDDIAKAMLVANPGCYPTCVSLPLLPLLQAGRLKANAPLIADCKSGVSGAGRKASTHALLCEAGDNFKAYGVGGHRHLPEIRTNPVRAARPCFRRPDFRATPCSNDTRYARHPVSAPARTYRS